MFDIFFFFLLWHPSYAGDSNFIQVCHAMRFFSTSPVIFVFRCSRGLHDPITISAFFATRSLSYADVGNMQNLRRDIPNQTELIRRERQRKNPVLKQREDEEKKHQLAALVQRQGLPCVPPIRCHLEEKHVPPPILRGRFYFCDVCDQTFTPNLRIWREHVYTEHHQNMQLLHTTMMQSGVTRDPGKIPKAKMPLRPRHAWCTLCETQVAVHPNAWADHSRNRKHELAVRRKALEGQSKNPLNSKGNTQRLRID